MTLPKMPPTQAVQNVMAAKSTQLLTPDELVTFMNHNGFSDQEFAIFFGVTIQAVRLWKKGERDISLTNTRIIKLLMKFPHLMREF